MTLTRLFQFTRNSTERFTRLLPRVLWPSVDLLIRLWLGRFFLMSGMLKLTHWQSALEVAAHQYPMHSFGQAAASSVIVTIELLGSLLLAAGFATRYAAVLLLSLASFIQWAYRPSDSQLFWIALFGWYAIVGAGPLSIDGQLRRGLSHSALPGISRLLAVSEWIRVTGRPVYVSALRIWLAVSLQAVGLREMLPNLKGAASLALWFPLDRSAHVLPTAAIAIGFILLLGLGTRTSQSPICAPQGPVLPCSI